MGYSTGGFSKTPIGLVPEASALDLRGCHVRPESVVESLNVSKAEWLSELADMAEFYQKLGSEVPEELLQQLNAIKEEFEFF
jgi:phosphoenolpyruvate carboxykinase (GTP)